MENNKWTTEERKIIAAVVFPIIEIQKNYGRVMDAKILMQGWEGKFANRYTVEQLLFALDQYTDKKSDFPSPADIISILEPEEPKISDAQFVSAQRWQERNNNYSEFTDAYALIKRYKEQKKEERGHFEVTNEKILRIASSSVRRFGDPAIEDMTRKQVEKHLSDPKYQDWQNKIAEVLGQNTVRSWFIESTFDPDTKTITAPSEFVAGWITNEFKTKLDKIFDGDVKIIWVSEEVG